MVTHILAVALSVSNLELRSLFYEDTLGLASKYEFRD